MIAAAAVVVVEMSAEALICGDANGDGAVTVSDGVLVLRAAASLEDCEKAICDVNGDGAIGVSDGVLTLRKAAELPVVDACSGSHRTILASDGVGLGGAPSRLIEVDLDGNEADRVVGFIRDDRGQPVITDLALSPSGELFGTSFDRLYRIDRGTAVAQPLPNGHPINGVNALAFRADGVLFGADFQVGAFIRIDPTTGSGTIIGTYGSGFISWGDFAFAPDGRMFATVATSFSGSGARSVLVTVDVATGRATPVGGSDIGFANVWGLQFVDDVLFGLTADPSGAQRGVLLEIDVNSGLGAVRREIDFRAFGGT